MTAFLEISGRYELLSKREEIELGRRIQKWMQWKDGPCPRSVVRSGRRARDRFVLCNMRLVTRIARSYTRRIQGTGMTFEDILHEGVLGLQRAAEKYDPESGYAMSTYATWWIRQAMSRALDMKGGIIHLSSNAKRKLYKFRQAAQAGGTLAEILERAELKERDLHIIEQAAMCYVTAELDAMELYDAI